jgi:hypothetical protein
LSLCTGVTARMRAVDTEMTYKKHYESDERL